MKITKKQIKELHPCLEGWNWYQNSNKEEDLEKLLLDINKVDSSWSRWLFTNLMTKKQNVEIAIFSASEVLSIFEDKYPDDKRPRKAIEAAQKWLDDPTDKNASASASASASAYAASASASAYASASASASAYAASASASAYAYASASAASAYARKKLQEKIIKKAVEILEETNENTINT